MLGTTARVVTPFRMRKGVPTVLCISDVRGWAFAQNMKDLEIYLKGKFFFEHGFVGEWQTHRVQPPAMARFDVVFCLYHGWGIEPMLPWERTLGTLRAQWMFPKDQRKPQQKEFDVVNRYRAYHVVNRVNYEEYKSSCPNVVYLTNPVNMQRFPKPTETRGRLVASWNGNAQHAGGEYGDVKGFHTILQPLMTRLRLPFVYAEYNTRRLKPSEMPEFYQQGNVALCASMYEGASNSTMEAMACGQVLVTTDVGNHREMMESELAEYGDTGIVIVERSQEAFAEALTALAHNPARIAEMGEINRKEIQRAWSWDVWAARYADFLMTPCRDFLEGRAE